MELLEPLADLGLFAKIAIVGCWVVLVVLLAEGVNRFSQASSELVRKIIHIGTGNVILLAWWLKIPAWIGITASILASAVTLLSCYVPLLPSLSSKGRQSWGTFFYSVSIGVLIAWFWSIGQPQYAALGILVMTWGDGLAALVGQRFGQHRYRLWGMQKSWEGSLTMAGLSFAVTSLILLGTYGNLWQIWLVSGTIAIVATGLEAFSRYGIDNLTVPLSSAACSFVLMQWLSSSV